MSNRLCSLRVLPLAVLMLGPGLAAAWRLDAAVVGASHPAPSLTQARVDKLPPKHRVVWTAYLERSQQQDMRDRAALAAERKGLATIPPMPPENAGARSMPLDRDAAWYATVEARHVGDVIVSFQTPAGGWSKNFSMASAVRLPGESYTTNNLSTHLGPDDFDAPRDPNWNYVGTLDNDSTTTEIRFLALVSTANPGREGDTYRASCLHGIRYLLDAQFPNGGWPQVWPLEGGYHDAITFNDNALTLTATVMTDVASGAGSYTFVPAELRRQAGAAAAKAIECILATQMIVDGRRTVWAQQFDALTLAPVSGRNYEPAGLSSSESADVLMYLMSLPNPSAGIRTAIAAGIAWLKSAAIYGEEWSGGRGDASGRRLAAKAGVGPIWSRYYSLSTGKPIFGDRDKSLHDDVNELSLERRNGYSWYSAGPQRAIDAYAVWSKTHVAGTEL